MSEISIDNQRKRESLLRKGLLECFHFTNQMVNTVLEFGILSSQLEGREERERKTGKSYRRRRSGKIHT